MTNQEILTCSENIKHEYCCTVVRIGECFPIEGADRIQKTLVNGMDMVISKEIKPGDIMIYAANETALHPRFLSVNNLYGISDYMLNENAAAVTELIGADKKDEAKLLCGFFTPQNRVKLLKLRGTYSFGFLFSPAALAKWKWEVTGIDFENLIGMDFDTVSGELFVKAYVPRTNKPHRAGTGKPPVHNKFNKVFDESFRFHYDSKQFQREIIDSHCVNPDDIVVITPKLHGTSAIFARIECRILDRLPWYKRLWNGFASMLHLGENWQYISWHPGQDNVYASRTVLKNKWQDPKNPVMTTTTDVWGYYNNIMAPLLPDNCYVYGEIVGYMPESTRFIQKNYDYGCAPGESKLMPYRIVYIQDGKNVELDVLEVQHWAQNMIVVHPALKDILLPIPILYHGTLHNLYPQLKMDDSWYGEVLKALKSDKTHFGMEENEPLCRNKVPREGICIRIDEDPRPENFKLKCAKFLSKESKDIDAGEIDMEMLETNY